MRKYLFGTGLLSSITGGITLLRAARSDEPFTWRTALAWLSWGITFALAIGAVVDSYRGARGRLIDGDSSVDRDELFRKRVKGNR
ncbi:hypothetical protein [Microbacterium thalli]|uniref:hypothetical protein n=1 Tax=Microbacterium thalli TaxID=3027921 RepID=UPI0023660B9A|nr:hypothetical protein [Microbacterium thalli]MDD7929856.1 hypothetical protein [Microbacterium thalli]